jgi:hypothetical protein
MEESEYGVHTTMSPVPSSTAMGPQHLDHPVAQTMNTTRFCICHALYRFGHNGMANLCLEGDPCAQVWAIQYVTPLSLKLESYLRKKGLGRRVGVLRIET